MQLAKTWITCTAGEAARELAEAQKESNHGRYLADVPFPMTEAQYRQFVALARKLAESDRAQERQKQADVARAARRVKRKAERQARRKGRGK